MYIRKATKNDIKDMSRIYALSWKVGYRGHIADDYLNALQEDRWVVPFTQWMADGDKDMFVCCDGDIVVGAGICFLSNEEKYQGYGELQSIYVLPSYFKKGCGALLVEAMENAFRQKGVQNYYLWVLRENQNAKNFYTKMGLKPTHIHDILEIELQGQQLIDERWVKQLL